MVDSLLSKCQDFVTFFAQFMAGPKIIGAVGPSSLKLSEVITGWVRLENASCVVEFGPGTGSFTRIIRERIRPDATFFAIELNPHMVKILRKKYPDLEIYNDSVINMRRYLSEQGEDAADCIISGLPWAAFDENLQDELLDVAYDSLDKNGRFVTFMYLQSFIFPAGRKFNRKIRSKFPHVSLSKVVWGNLPPAIVYQAQK